MLELLGHELTVVLLHRGVWVAVPAELLVQHGVRLVDLTTAVEALISQVFRLHDHFDLFGWVLGLHLGLGGLASRVRLTLDRVSLRLVDLHKLTVHT